MSEWAVRLVGQVAMLAPSRVVGRIVALRAPGEYVSPANGRPVDAEVLVMESGHSYVAQLEGDFVPLTDAEAAFYERTADTLSMVVRGMVHGARRTCASPRTAAVLLAAALRAQAAALEVAPAPRTAQERPEYLGAGEAPPED